MFAQPTISYWGLSVERGLWRVGCSALNRLKWSVAGGRTPKPRAAWKRGGAPDPWAAAERLTVRARICVEGKSLKAIFLTGWLWKLRRGEKKKKAAQNCHLSIASCPCRSSSLLTDILRPSLASKVSSFLFLVAERGFRSALPLSTNSLCPQRE